MGCQTISPNDLELMMSDKHEAKKPGAIEFKLLHEITNNFSDEIGRGGYAKVYKGLLGNGMAVAVKKLSNPHFRDDKFFLREIECLMKGKKHRNIVRYLGYCCDTVGEIETYEEKNVIGERLKRLICFEYVPEGNLRSHINDASCGLEWRERYKIIKGICEGLNYLHTKGITHRDLKPENILMDNMMVPKIADFGLSRYSKDEQTHASTTNHVVTFGYAPPEFDGRKVTRNFDIYSLGVIIMEIVTGERGHHKPEAVLESWSNRLETSMEEDQVRVCIEIAVESTQFEPEKRPVKAQDIIDRLVATELLNVYLFKLGLPTEPNTDKQLVFRLTNKSRESWQYFASIPLYVIVPSRSTYTLVVTAKQQDMLPEEIDYDLIQQSSISEDKNIHAFRDQLYLKKYDQFYEDAGNDVHEVKLKTTFATSEDAASRRIKNRQIISMKNTHGVLCCLDAQTTEPWIVTGHQHRDVCIWNYYPQRGMDSFNIWKESVMHSYSSSNKVHSVKVISRKEKTWFVAATSDGVIHVYDYNNKMEEVSSFRAASDSFITSMAVHPTNSYLLSSAHRAVKLWDWDNGWKECQPSFNQEHYASIRQVAFNPKNTNIFATASDDHTIKRDLKAITSQFI
ncbi:unnamed protein product [Triticum turgidum subsp. durum]|uniref:non-specific serine/threonine protein kinase n=1 Tax=Triticum turgidum subsp. durum TaxID=4567 RepID=A0A9R1QUU1_TRITD|nr:unnamed protein product [Triticum turgidum subsp. durum]